MLAVIVGFMVAVLSLWGMFIWRQDLMIVLRGFFPLCFLCGGILAMVVGFFSRRPGGPDLPGGNGHKE